MLKLLALTLGLCVGAFALAEDDAAPTSVAVEFARSMRAHDQLRLMLKGVAENTVTIKGLVAAHGREQVEPVLKDEIERVASSHDDEWTRNLALCYQTRFSEDELRVLTTDKQSSAYGQKLRNEMPAVGEAMQTRSQGLLTIAAQDVVVSTFRHFSGNH